MQNCMCGLQNFGGSIALCWSKEIRQYFKKNSHDLLVIHESQRTEVRHSTTTHLREFTVYSFIRRSMSFSRSDGTLTSPFLLTKNLPLKFHIGSLAPVFSLKNRQTKGASGPLMGPSFIRMPGYSLPAANLATSSSVGYSCPPNSRVGKPSMINLSPHRSPSDLN